MATEIARFSIPPQVYNPGSIVIGPIGVPRQIDGVELIFSRATVSGDAILRVRVEALIGGQWREAGGFEVSCAVGPNWPGPGDPTITLKVQEVGGVQATQIRMRATLIGGSARIGGTAIALGD